MPERPSIYDLVLGKFLKNVVAIKWLPFSDEVHSFSYIPVKSRVGMHNVVRVVILEKSRYLMNPICWGCKHRIKKYIHTDSMVQMSKCPFSKRLVSLIDSACIKHYEPVEEVYKNNGFTRRKHG